MFIEKITLQNIKSYGSTPTTIEFKEGINLIVGANGAGKSTILEAIGFVLFNTLPYDYSDFERRGKSGATRITVRLHSTYDNRVYDVERAIPARYKVIDVQDHIAERIQSKDDLLEWLCQHLKIDNKEDLASLFQNAIGVQQGTITAVFLESQNERKKKFDALLRVEDYENAWNELGETRKYISELLNKNANEIARKEGQSERLSELEPRVEADRKRITEKEKEHVGFLEKLEILKTLLEQLDLQKGQIDELNQQIEQANAAMKHLEASVATAQKDYEKSVEASRIITENEAANRLHNEAADRLKALEKQQKKRDALVNEQRKIEKKIDATKQRIGQLEKDLVEVENAEARLIQLDPLVQQQEQLEHEQGQALEEQKEQNRLQKQITEDKQKHDSLKTELQELRERVGQRKQIAEQVEQLRYQADDLTIQINECSTKRSSLEQQLEVAQQAFDSADEHFREYERLQESVGQQETALKKAKAEQQRISDDLAQREELTKQIDTLTGQITESTSEKIAAETALQRIRDDLAELQQMRQILGEEGAVCPVCRREMVGQAHAEAIDYYNAQEQKLKDEQQSTRDNLKQLKASLKEWQTEKASIEGERDKLANQIAFTKSETEIAAINDEIARLQKLLATITDAPQVRTDAEATLTNARHAFDQQNNHINELKAHRAEQTQEIADLNAQMAHLPSEDELKRREDEYDALIAKITQDELRLRELDGIDAQVQRLKDALISLGNPREKQAIAQNSADKREGLEKARQESQASLASAQSEFETYQQKLKVYENLDMDMDAARTQRDDTEQGHQLYVAHRPIAELLGERESQLTKLQAELAQAAAQRDTDTQQRDELAENFDFEAYESHKNEHDELESNQTELGAEIRQLKKQLTDMESEIENLHVVVNEIQELQTVGERLKNEQTTFEFVRRSIREAGPRIRKRKVQLVSEVAANYFSEIINDYTMRLQWNSEDYGISIEQSGEMRPFNVLSGGEQMIAALSVRLALLTHMTSIRLVFLDEPTINLDANRRIQLAERLRQIKGLQQLFVISHDDTFIEDSHHVINVIKEDGVSHVEMSHAALY